MSGGYTGKILRVDLTSGTISTINTSDYEEWGGGHGIGSAIFWDLAVVPGNWDLMDGFDERNVVTIMASPLCGTMVPSAGGRTEIQGVGVQAYSKECPNTGWFNRSNHGGRFSAELKYAGWDGIAIEGKASVPVWINIIDDDVEIRDASAEGDKLWGLDVYQTQQEIWRIVAGDYRYGEWIKLAGGDTTQRPAVEAIGPAGENKSRLGAIVHDGGNGAGHGGFGGIWGSKNLKAIGVIGTGGVPVDDPKALVDTRRWQIDNYSYDVDNPFRQTPTTAPWVRPGYSSGYGFGRGMRRYSACRACLVACRGRYASGLQSESNCMDTWFRAATTEESQQGADQIQRYGIDAYGISGVNSYVAVLNKAGILGPGKQIDCDLPFSQSTHMAYARAFCDLIAYRQGVGNDMTEGVIRWSAKLGRLEEDLTDGTLQFPAWGQKTHHYFPGNEWCWAELVSERDINEHDFQYSWRCLQPFAAGSFSGITKDYVSAEQAANIMAEKCVPIVGENSPFNWDHGHGSTGIYSRGRATAVGYFRHSTRFYKQSLGFCDAAWPQYVTSNTPDFRGPSGADTEAEIKYFNAVTGNNFTWADGMKVGRKIWNLDRAIWILQGRHRDNEIFAPYMHTDIGRISGIYMFPVYLDGKWQWWFNADFKENKPVFTAAGAEEFKTHFYDLEGWDTSSGWPKRKTLEDLGMKNVADLLAAKGKLGSG